ncbi:MAG: TIGR01906 family membrane protein [Anaerolineaceae bacterium]|nr:TIGR01906 family membrane protein [Anaerolineaceae bacterium]
MKRINQISSWLVTISSPFVIIMLAVRILFTPLFLIIEYNFPGFPPDSYGFTTEDRLRWGTDSMNYLFDRTNTKSFSDLKFEDGSNIYNDREISHMIDVKVLLQKMLNIFYVILGIYILIFIASIKNKNYQYFYKGLSRGGWVTIGLLTVIIAGIVISFDQLFTLFHKLFFTGDTWLFNYSDTLIRLFPMRLWQDAFIMMGVISLIISFVCVSLGKKQRKNEIVGK